MPCMPPCLQSFVGIPDRDVVFWTLGVELAFYVIMGALFALKLLDHTLKTALVWLGLSVVWSLTRTQLPYGVGSFAAKLLILPHAPYFIAGILFYLIRKHGLSRERLGLLALALVAAALADRALGGITASIVFVIVGVALSGGLRFAVSPVTLWLGAISFPLYLLHRNSGYLLLFKLQSLGLTSIASVAIALAFALALASLVHFLVEKPAMRVLRQWYKARSAAPAALET